MTNSVPPTLRILLDAREQHEREQAWAAFVREYSRLIHHGAKAVADGYDATMDRYAFVLDRLEEDECRRLRTYESDGHTKFTTWLVIVARRLSIDFHRARYGRAPAKTDGDTVPASATSRHRLVDLVGAQMEIDELVDDGATTADAAISAAELRAVLAKAIATLSDHDRLLVKLRFEDDATAGEIAVLMGFNSQFHVYRRLKTIFRRMKKELERHGVRGPTP